MNKHAKTLRTLPVILPAGIDPAILNVLARAADEIDRLELSKECPGCLISSINLREVWNKTQSAHQRHKEFPES